MRRGVRTAASTGARHGHPLMGAVRGLRFAAGGRGAGRVDEFLPGGEGASAEMAEGALPFGHARLEAGNGGGESGARRRGEAGAPGKEAQRLGFRIVQNTDQRFKPGVQFVPQAGGIGRGAGAGGCVAGLRGGICGSFRGAAGLGEAEGALAGGLPGRAGNGLCGRAGSAGAFRARGGGGRQRPARGEMGGEHPDDAPGDRFAMGERGTHHLPQRRGAGRLRHLQYHDDLGDERGGKLHRLAAEALSLVIREETFVAHAKEYPTVFEV